MDTKVSTAKLSKILLRVKFVVNTHKTVNIPFTIERFLDQDSGFVSKPLEVQKGLF